MSRSASTAGSRDTGWHFGLGPGLAGLSRGGLAAKCVGSHRDCIDRKLALQLRCFSVLDSSGSQSALVLCRVPTYWLGEIAAAGSISVGAPGVILLAPTNQFGQGFSHGEPAPGGLRCAQGTLREDQTPPDMSEETEQ